MGEYRVGEMLRHHASGADAVVVSRNITLAGGQPRSVTLVLVAHGEPPKDGPFTLWHSKISVVCCEASVVRGGEQSCPVHGDGPSWIDGPYSCDPLEVSEAVVEAEWGPVQHERAEQAGDVPVFAGVRIVRGSIGCPMCGDMVDDEYDVGPGPGGRGTMLVTRTNALAGHMIDKHGMGVLADHG